MQELLRIVDPAAISFIESLLTEANIDYLIADQHTSMIEGSIGILPKRFLVPDDMWDQARCILQEAGLAHELSELDNAIQQ
ncbi:MAG: DUF2007 domain-containing protein [Pseudomonadota bacterium]